MVREECRVQPWHLLPWVCFTCSFSREDVHERGGVSLPAACECWWGTCGFSDLLLYGCSMSMGGLGGRGIVCVYVCVFGWDQQTPWHVSSGGVPSISSSADHTKGRMKVPGANLNSSHRVRGASRGPWDLQVPTSPQRCPGKAGVSASKSLLAVFLWTKSRLLGEAVAQAV